VPYNLNCCSAIITVTNINQCRIGITDMPATRSSVQGTAVPPRKPLDEKKQPLSVTIEPDHRKWLRENYLHLGFRSESHAVDQAIRLLMEARGGEKAKAPRS
jgi:hypothetical protein